MSSSVRLPPGRADSLIEALINGVHWQQVLLHEAGQDKGDPEYFGRGTTPLDRIKAIAQTFEDLAAVAPDTLASWARNETDDGQVDLLASSLNDVPRPPREKLPVNALIAWMAKRLKGTRGLSMRAVANLCQLCLQVDRDGTTLQDLYRIHIAMGLRVNLSQLGLPAQESDLIAIGKEMASAAAKGPFDSSAAAWHITFRKIENWGDKNTGRRDQRVLAKEILQDPEVRELIPALKAGPPRRAAFLGFSMMMSLNWSSHGAWNDIASLAMKDLRPDFEHGNFQTGGIRASAARKKHLADVLAFQPTETFLLMSIVDEQDRRDFESMLHELKAAGSEAYVIDDVRPWVEQVQPDAFDVFAFRKAACERAGGKFLPFYELGKTHPNWRNWPCLDRIHMVTEGHEFYAKALMKLWAGRPVVL